MKSLSVSKLVCTIVLCSTTALLLGGCAAPSAGLTSVRYAELAQPPKSFELRFVQNPRMTREALSDKYFDAYQNLGYFELERLLQDAGMPFLQRRGFNRSPISPSTNHVLEFLFSSTNFAVMPGKTGTPITAEVTMYDASGKQKIWRGEFRLNLGGDEFWGGLSKRRVSSELLETFLNLVFTQMKADGVLSNLDV